MKVDPQFIELYEREHVRVFQVTFALCGDRGLAEDATQEAFARALERWGRLREQQWVGGWVMRTALNVARRSLRRRFPFIPTRRIEEEDESAVELWGVVRSLPRRQREAVVLHYIVDLPVTEVAAAMGCREGTVKAHLAHARDTLRSQLLGATNER